MDSLFAQPQKKPLADRMRPTRLSDFVGQETAVGERSPLRRMIEKDQLQSVLFYGPPGTGKTTLGQGMNLLLSMPFHPVYLSCES